MCASCVISNLPCHLQGRSSHLHVADEETSSERAVTCPRPHSRSVARVGFMPDPKPPEPTFVTVTLLQSPFPSLRVEITVYPIFYEQVSKEASRMCEQARGFINTAPIRELSISQPPTRLALIKGLSSALHIVVFRGL